MTGPHRPGLTQEQAAISRTVADLVTLHSAESAVRAAMATESGFDGSMWTRLTEIGVPGLAVPEAYGGLGLGLTELSLVMERAGASLLCAPLLSSTVLATTLLLEVGQDAAKEDLLPALAAGDRRGSVVLGGAGAVGGGRPSVRAESAAGGWVLSGSAEFVIDGHTADDLFVVAETAGVPGLFAVDARALGVTRSPMRTLDPTRKQAAVAFSDVGARRLDDGDVASGLARTLDVARVMLAAEQVGGAERCSSTAVVYARERVQFDRPIGSFQAIKHQCAEMLIRLEGARVTMAEAVRAAAGASPDLPCAASLAKAVCSEAFFSIASDALHVHGGIGFTWEHSSHLYFRRAKSDQLLLGTPSEHRERLLDVAGLARTSAAGGAA